MTSTKRPIAATSVISADGSSHVRLHVFCARRAESVPIDECRACPRLEEISGDPSGERSWVTCEASPNEGCVGSILRGYVVFASDDLPSKDLTAMVVERGLPFVLVVDADGLLVGIVRDVNLLRDPLRESDLKVRDLMSNASAVCEAEPVREALVTMASKHLREVPVVTREGRLVGVVRDVDALARLNSMNRSPTK